MADQSYTLQFTDPTKTVVVPPLTINGPLLPSTTETYPNSSGSSTSIGLVGRGEPNYGRVILNNLLQMLEHFSYPTAPTNPVVGQLWHNSVINSLNLFTDAGWVDVTGNDMFVKKTGGEMAGTLTFPVDTKLHLNYTPVSQVDAINVLYADTKYLAKTGGTVTGNLTISNGSRITSSAIPTTNAHLTNKLYVDQAIDSISLTTNRIEKNNPDGSVFTFGNPVSKIDDNDVQLSDANSTVDRAVVLGLCINESNTIDSLVVLQSYGTLIGTTAQWDVITGGVGGLQTGLDYFISTTPGMITANPSSTSGHFLTKVGTAVAIDTLVIDIQSPFRL